MFALLLSLPLLFQPAKETVEIPGTKLKFEVVALPGDKTLKPFKIGAREVTWAEFNAFHKNPKDVDAVTRPTLADSYFGEAGIPSEVLEPKRPLTNVRWHSAVMYCEWLSRKTGATWRLPTEAEWEHAARAGSTAADPDELDSTAWHEGNSGGTTHPGGTKRPNAFGLYDMIGNVWEYVLEPLAPPEYGPVLKGGCWSSPARELRYAHRQPIPYKWFAEDTNLPRSVWWLTTSEASIGFRVVCAADAADLAEREATAAKIETKITGSASKMLRTGASTAFYRLVTGEVRNGGGRALDEVELRVHYLESDGRPHLVDLSGSKPGRASFSKVWPVLANGAAGSPARAPLQPGETRAFELYVPASWDLDTKEGAKMEFGAAVTALRFAK